LVFQGEAFSSEHGNHRIPGGAFEVNGILRFASVGLVVPVLFGCSPSTPALGMPVQTIIGDSGNNKSVASVSLQRSVDKGAQVIIGATTSAMSLSVIDQAVAAGVLLLSPANTAVKLSDPAIPRGLYFRTAPPDSYEGSVLAGLAFDEGKRSVAILQIDDAYGAKLADTFTLAFEERSGRVVAREVYDPAASSFADVVAKVKAAKADAIVPS
jgi:branched-chain amino acid transport system substrate-binding protein